MNTAVNGCVPTANVVFVDAVPLARGAAVPTLAAPSLNCTVPAAVDGVTVAVNVSGEPAVAGEAGVTVSVVVVAFTMSSDTVFDVDPTKFVVSVGTNTAVS
jgi:hypothetical protein